MSLNRLVFAGLIVVSILMAGGEANPDSSALPMMTVYVNLALAVLGHIFLNPGVCRPRRLVALGLDIGFLSWQLHLGGEATSLFVLIYLWVVFGNGFRFGVAWLHAAMTAALVGFGAVVWSTPFWREQMHLSFGLLAGFLILPLYAGTLIRRLSLARQQAEEASRAKTLFLASVSHELRTPLNAVIGMGSLLLDTPLKPDQREMARTVDSAARLLLLHIDRILDMTRTEVGRMPVRPVEFDLLELLSEVRRMVAAQARAKGLTVALHLTPRTPPRLLGDRRHLCEILLNLANNAVKFTESGGVVLAADAAPQVPETGGRLRLILEVSDTGIGIAQEAKVRIFDDFTQADSTILDRYGGTGLGLALCKRLAELLKGKVTVESAPGVGSTFHLEVDVEQANPGQPWLPAAGAAAVIMHSETSRSASRALAGRIAMQGVSVITSEELREASGQPPRIPTLLFHDDNVDYGTNGDEQSAAILVTTTPTEGLPPVALRRRFAAVLSAAPTENELRAALRIACTQNADLAAVTLEQPTCESPEAKVALHTTQSPLRVLVADDNRVNQRVIEMVLNRAGHETRIVANGEAALDALEQCADDFDLVLMDINMPQLDGLEATKLFRFMSLGTRHLPILALTADATNAVAERCIAAGMDGCIVKPVEPARLLELVEATARRPVAVDAGTVNAISGHPRFRQASAQTVEEKTLYHLRDLGGHGFVAEVVEEFLSEAGATVRALSTAAVAGNAASFQAYAHALRSSASNVGAVALSELCVPWQTLSSAELLSRATQIKNHAEAELERTRREFQVWQVATSSSSGR